MVVDMAAAIVEEGDTEEATAVVEEEEATVAAEEEVMAIAAQEVMAAADSDDDLHFSVEDTAVAAAYPGPAAQLDVQEEEEEDLEEEVLHWVEATIATSSCLAVASNSVATAQTRVWQVYYVVSHAVQEYQPFEIHYTSHNLVDDGHVTVDTQVTTMKTNMTTRIGGQTAMRLVTT